MSEPTPQDYKDAVNGIGPLAPRWADKPHRLVYDLVSALTLATERAEKAEADLDQLLVYLEYQTAQLARTTERAEAAEVKLVALQQAVTAGM